ncbi:MAG: hypothetical protein OEW11_04925 [Nitrospirota bacterium]|nr:hypothetical protein [Nitrospirota bacterium]
MQRSTTIQTLTAGLLAAALTLAAGCGPNDDTPQARLVDAQMAIDKGNFATAETLLLTFCTDPLLPATCDPAVLETLAEAQLGQGGVDTISFINAVGASTALSTFDLVRAMVGGTTDLVAVAAQVASLERAMTTLLTITPPRTANQELLMAMANSTHLVLAISLATSNGAGAVPAGLGAAVAADLNAMVVATGNVVIAVGGATSTTDKLNALAGQVGATGTPLTLSDANLQTFVTGYAW